MAHNVSIRQLQAFREVMRSGSVSEAARILGRTQPAVSALIANLEAELQLSLFRRQKGRMEPTPEALFFAGEAEAILDRLAVSTRTMAEIGKPDQGAPEHCLYARRGQYADAAAGGGVPAGQA